MRNILEAFFRRRGAIILIALVAITLIAVGTYSRVPRYMSETRFMIPIGREMGTPTANVQAAATLLMVNYTDQIATQMEILNNRRLVENAIDAMPPEIMAQKPVPPPLLGIVESIRNRIVGAPEGNAGENADADTKETGNSIGGSIRAWLVEHGILHNLTEREKLIIDCSSLLKIERQNDSGVIHVKFTHPSPEFAQMFLVKFLAAYQNLRAASGTAGSDMPFYAGQETQLRNSLREASDRLAAFRREWGLRDIQAQREQYTTELARLDQVVNQNRTDQTQAQAFLEALNTQEGRDEPESILSRVMRDDPGMVHNLRSIAALLARESRLRAEVGKDHPELTLIEREMRELRDGLHRSAVATLHTQALNARVILEETSRLRDETEERMATLEAKTIEMRALESEVEVAADALLSYGRNREAARVTSQMDDLGINTVMVIEPPTRPYSPVSPKPIRDIALGVIFSVLLALYYAYFMESFSDTIFTVESVAEKFPETAVISVPEVRKRPDGTLAAPEHALAMLGRKFFYKDKRLSLPKSVLVVGTNKNAGTTSLAKMLAEYMARTYNCRVLLVDAHLSPRLKDKPAEDEGAPAAVTLSDWLIDRSKMPEPCLPGEVGVLASGRGGPEARAAMLRITQEQLPSLGNYDTLIFDAPPLNADSVTFHLASLTEATLPVLRMEHTRKAVLESMNDDLVMSGASVLGIVCNRRRFYIPQWIYKRLS